MKLILLFISFFILFLSGYGQQNKMNGISLVGINEPLTTQHVKPLIEVGPNYAAVIPFGFKTSLSGTDIQHNLKNLWYGETKEGIKKSIQLLQSKNLKIMIKPQIWVSNGAYTGDIRMSSEKNWVLLEKSYTEFISVYARIAEELNVDIFCIGTELKLFASARPEYWRRLIKELRSIYKGQLTYAANWDEYIKVRFWEDLDYIGIDAYFPVSVKKTPSVEDCKKGWKKTLNSIKYIAKVYDKKVIFTEYGYRSTDYAGREPWNSDAKITKVNLEAQSNATQALMEMFWHQDWFAGGFLWKWRPGDDIIAEQNSRFTPQNKPVLNVIESFFKKEDTGS